MFTSIKLEYALRFANYEQHINKKCVFIKPSRKAMLKIKGAIKLPGNIFND